MEAFSIQRQIGETNLIEHDIVLEPNTQALVEPLRRRPYAHKLEAKKQIENMLAEGVIEPSESPWASAYVLVSKKTGDMRLCIDFRKLNERTKKNVYPLPNIEDCLEPLSGNNYFSQLDLASGYWQIKMAEQAKELTAFRTEEGHFQFRRMPFGLCNVPASFQRLVNALFGGLKGIHLQVFIDDICVASRTWDEHLILLEKVFVILERANLKLKTNKCTFGASHVLFLGHELSNEGIRQDPNKVKAIPELPRPNNAAEVRRILGFFNFYRRFVPKFAQLSAVITQLTRKNVTFEWTNEHQQAFNDLKEALCRNTTLAHFNHKDPLVLKTDAAKTGVAGILLQQQQGEWVMITCCSRRLSAAEENYGISDLEGLAIIYSVTKLRNYLLGKQFNILTDHCALCSLKSKVPNSPRLRRLALILSEYEFSIQYIRGGLHQDVDCLSRAPVDNAIDPWLDDKVLSVISQINSPMSRVIAITVPTDNREWKELTETDEDAKNHLVKARSRKKGYKIPNGLLYYENRLYVPNAKRSLLMEEAHADNPSCHGGQRATLERISNLWWPNMAEDVRNHARSCKICRTRKTERAARPGEMFSFNAIEPFQLVAFDFLGPLPESLSQMKHVIIGIDCFSRFIDAEAMADVRGATFASYLNRYIGRFGIPRVILTDNAPSFCNSDVQSILERFHIEHRKSTPHHHEGNSMAERVIQTFQEKLSLITHDITHSINWEEYVPNAVLSVNTTCHSSTGYTPFELIFGKAHLMKTSLVTEESDAQQVYSELRELRSNNMRAEALAAQFDSQTQSRHYFDKRHRQLSFEIGDIVLAKLMGRRSKLQNRYVGPYLVVQRENDVYKIESLDGRKDKLQRHIQDLKPYIVRENSNRLPESNRPSSEPDQTNYQNITASIVSFTRW